jgi:hypothetical protein
MTADVVNLRRARKAKGRSEREAAADRNRARFGRSKAEKEKDAAERARAERALEAHRRDKPEA